MGNQVHSRALTLVERGQADQDDFVASLTPEERDARGEERAWAAKDQVAHNNFWRRDAVRKLEAARDGQTPPDTSDEQAQNDRAFQTQRDTDWEELLMATQRLRAETAALIEQLSVDDLSERDRYPWQDGDSLETLILVNWYDHPAEHWTDFYVKRGDIDHAIDLRQSVANTVKDLFADKPKLYSFMAYKLGALYASNGRPPEAIDALREAIGANPGLVVQVQSDSDLDALRGFAEFQAIAGN